MFVLISDKMILCFPNGIGTSTSGNSGIVFQSWATAPAKIWRRVKNSGGAQYLSLNRCFSLLMYLRGSNRVPVDEEPRVHIFLPRKRKVSPSFGVTNEDMVPEAERSAAQNAAGGRGERRCRWGRILGGSHDAWEACAFSGTLASSVILATGNYQISR